MDLTLILPTYKERKNIEVLVPQIHKLLSSKTSYSFEIMVADDSSPDGTADAVRILAKKYKNVRLLLRTQKEGLGAALIDAYNHAKGDRIMSMDSDLAFPLEDVLKILKKIDTGYDLVVGSRHGGSQGAYEKKHLKTYIKSFVSTTGNAFTRTFLTLPVHDFSLNFRVIRRSMWKKLNVTEKNNTMLLEMIVRTRQQGGKITEVPVTFKDRIYGESKMQLSKQAPMFLKKVLQFGIRERLGMN